jgi:transposase
MRRLVKLHGIGAEFATVLTREVFYRPFQNRRQVASYVGLTPIAVQMAWLWLRYQSKSYRSGITGVSGTSRVGSDASLARTT